MALNIALAFAFFLFIGGAVGVLAVRPASGGPGRSRATALRWAGLIIGAVAGVLVARPGDLGTGLLLAAPLFGGCVLAGVIAGELTHRAPDGPVRTAGLEVRRVRDYLPPRLVRAVAAAGAILLVVLAATTAAGGPDDENRPGRWLTRACTPDLTESVGPWPGVYYSVPLALVLLAGLLLAAVAVRAVVRRPRSTEAAEDDALRRRSARVVTGAAGVLIAVPLGGVGLLAGFGLRGIDCGPAAWTVAGWVALALVPAALGLAGWCLTAMLAPADRAPQPERAR